jgi:hypothetical protein
MAVAGWNKEVPVTVLTPHGVGGLYEESMMNLAQVLTIGKARLIKKPGNLDAERIIEVDDEAIKVSFGIR